MRVGHVETRHDSPTGKLTAKEDANLALLETHLRKVAPARFDFATFVDPGWDQNEKHLCKTAACALGHATTIPELRTQGLYMHSDGFPSLKGREDEGTFTVARVLFGLSFHEYQRLFMPGHGLSELAKAVNVADEIAAVRSERGVEA